MYFNDVIKINWCICWLQLLGNTPCSVQNVMTQQKESSMFQFVIILAAHQAFERAATLKFANLQATIQNAISFS